VVNSGEVMAISNGAQKAPQEERRLIKLLIAPYRRQIATILLLAPPTVFLLVNFIFPIGFFLERGADNWEISQAMPTTSQRLLSWSGVGTPSEEVYAALAKDLREASQKGIVADLGRRLNYNIPGFRGLITQTARSLAGRDISDYKTFLTTLDRRWGERAYWLALKQDSGRYTPFYLLAALDLRTGLEGGLVQVDKDRRVYRQVIFRTFVISISLTILCLVIGYPVAYLLANIPKRISAILLMFVLLPFWTSMLVRTTAWVIILQNQGLVNKVLLELGILSKPIQLIGNRFAVLVAMTHVLLPYMVLPLYSVMCSISPQYMQAAANLGANPLSAFRTVYLPQTRSGIGAGCVLVFILALGYYITPMLVGGPADQMISYFIALFTNESLNWGMASALGSVLLIITASVYVLFHRTGLAEGIGEK
jgi:putative spermidine/putrescine transport system permease protein